MKKAHSGVHFHSAVPNAEVANGDIREMTIADYPAVIRLWKDTEGMTLRDADSKDNVEQYLKHNPGLSFIVVDKDRVVGAVLAGTDGRRGYIQHLSVAENQRCKGLGQQLLTTVLDALKSLQIFKTHLFVHNTNDYAQRYYLKSGWQARDEVRMFSYNNSDNNDV